MKQQLKGFFVFLFCFLLLLTGCGSKSVLAEGEGSLLDGTSWISVDDGSLWVFNEDQTFKWYQSKEVTSDNYFAGTYEFHIGRDALDYLINDLSEYGVTENEMQQIFDMNEEYGLDNFVCFSTTNQSLMLNGTEQLAENKVTSYFGFLLQDGTYLDIANMLTGTYYGFTKESETR